MFKDDPTCVKLLADSEALELINTTKVAADVDASQYTVVFYPGIKVLRVYKPQAQTKLIHKRFLIY